MSFNLINVKSKKVWSQTIEKQNLINVENDRLLKEQRDKEQLERMQKEREEKDRFQIFLKEVGFTIPLNIFQCWHSDDLPDSVRESVENIKSSNPEFTHHLYNDTMCREFIKSNFDEDVLYAYDSLIPYAYRFDLWRYCILYKYGGIYLDTKYHCINNFKFIYLVHQEYFCQDLKESGLGIYNAILICKPNNPILLECIQKVVDNVQNEFYGENGLYISGPLMIKPMINSINYEIKLFHTYKIENVILFYICHETFPILQIHVNYRKEQEQIGEFWHHHYSNKTVYAKKYEVETYRFRLYENCVISEVLKKGQLWEEHLHKVFEQYIQPDFICVEAGCHIGAHTLKMAGLCKKLYAFEPLPESYKLLDYNLRTNKIKNTILSICGLSDKPGNTTYGWSMEGNPGASGLNNNPMGNPIKNTELKAIEVSLITLDSLELDKLDFIKIDVEGYEPLVIQGAIKTIIKCRPIITLESWSSHKGGISMDDTKTRFKMLLDLGYTVSNISGPDYLFLP